MKIYIVFTGRENFAEDTIARLDAVDMKLYGKDYAIFGDKWEAKSFLSELKKIQWPEGLSADGSLYKFPDASLREFEVV